MTRWDDRKSIDHLNDSELEEARLLEKFQDYKNLEKREIERSFSKSDNRDKPVRSSNRGIISIILKIPIAVSAIFGRDAARK